VKPVLQEFPGWDGNVSDARKIEDIPEGARRLVDFIEEFTGVPVHGYSVGPLRDETFMKVEPWTQS
jgi:adenylosuccinate synthase